MSDSSSSSSSGELECGSSSTTSHEDLPLRIGAVFILLSTSLLATFFPLVSHSSRTPKWLIRWNNGEKGGGEDGSENGSDSDSGSGESSQSDKHEGRKGTNGNMTTTVEDETPTMDDHHDHDHESGQKKKEKRKRKKGFNIRIPKSVYEFAKYFGSGVIVATAFIHLLDPSFEALSSPCLAGTTWSIYPWSSAISMCSVFFIFVLELLAFRLGHWVMEKREKEAEERGGLARDWDDGESRGEEDMSEGEGGAETDESAVERHGKPYRDDDDNIKKGDLESQLSQHSPSTARPISSVSSSRPSLSSKRPFTMAKLPSTASPEILSAQKRPSSSTLPNPKSTIRSPIPNFLTQARRATTPRAPTLQDSHPVSVPAPVSPQSGLLSSSADKAKGIRGRRMSYNTHESAHAAHGPELLDECNVVVGVGGRYMSERELPVGLEHTVGNEIGERRKRSLSLSLSGKGKRKGIKELGDHPGEDGWSGCEECRKRRCVQCERCEECNGMGNRSGGGDDDRNTEGDAHDEEIYNHPPSRTLPPSESTTETTTASSSSCPGRDEMYVIPTLASTPTPGPTSTTKSKSTSRSPRSRSLSISKKDKKKRLRSQSPSRFEDSEGDAAKDKGEGDEGDEERDGKSAATSHTLTPESGPQSGRKKKAKNGISPKKNGGIEGSLGSHSHSHSHSHHSHDHQSHTHTHSHSHTEDPISAMGVTAQLIGVAILEFGIVLHSIIIGLTLGVTTGFGTLLVVVCFHQMFEGLGLGTRLATLPLRRSSPLPWLGALGYACVTPVGLAIGLGARKSYDPEGVTALKVQGVLDGVSSGILIYTGLVELLAHEFIFNEGMRKAPLGKLLYALTCMLTGAALMALLGRWA